MSKAVALRKAVAIIALVLLILALLVMVGAWQLGRSLKSLGIEQLDYQLQTLSLHQLGFARLAFVYTSAERQILVSATDANMVWQWSSGWLPRLMQVDIENVQLTFSASGRENASVNNEAIILPDKWSIPAAIPHISINRLVVNAPCPTGVCSLAGSGELQANPDSLALTLSVSPGAVYQTEHQLQITAGYRLLENFPRLEARLVLGENIDLQLTSFLAQEPEIYWSGELAGHAGYPDEKWQAALADWQVQLKPEWDKAMHQPIALDSRWNLALEPLIALLNGSDKNMWQGALTGTLAVVATVPVPIELFALGEFSGRVNMELGATRGHIDRYLLRADIAADKLVVPESLQQQGLTIDSAQLAIKSQPDESGSLTNLPLELQLDIQGAVEGTASAQVVLDIANKKIIAESLMARVEAKKIYPHAELALENLILELHASGFWHPEKFALHSAAPSKVSADVKLPALEIAAAGTQLAIAQLDVAGAMAQGKILWPELSFTSDFALSVARLMHPQVQPKPWHWQAAITGQSDAFDVKGELMLDNKLTVKQHIKRRPQSLDLNWQLPNVFLLAGNPVAETIVAWPSLLTLMRGKIKASGELRFDLLTLQLTASKTLVELNDLSGIYDTATFGGLTTNLDIRTSTRKLEILAEQIKLAQLSKGFTAGPLVASVSYEADMKALTGGKLDLAYFRGDLMGGSVSTPPRVFNLRDDKQLLLVELENIDLATLLREHPTSDLSGSGRLSGKVPIEVSAAGVSVSKGVVSAEPPGGQLHYRSERAAAIAQKQPGMKLITDALDDFHYSVLASEVNYDETGKLLLSIRLQGKNPAIEKGRPINFNINLEEDLPAMITSIQLANNISDIVKRRLQERLRKDNNASGAK